MRRGYDSPLRCPTGRSASRARPSRRSASSTSCATAWPRRWSAARATWADLGCGNGVAAADALGGDVRRRARCSSTSTSAARRGRRARAARGRAVHARGRPRRAGRASQRVRAALSPATRARRHVLRGRRAPADVRPARRAARRARRRGRTTVLLSVPNDAFWAIENPYHETMWGEGAFAELRRMLPEGTVRRAAGRAPGLGGIPLEGDGPATTTAEVTLHAPGRRPDPLPRRHRAARGRARAHAARRADRPRRAAPLGAPARGRPRLPARRDRDRVARGAAQNDGWFEEWRTYIHELEGRLGLPPTGAAPEELPGGDVAVKVAFLVNDLQLSGGVGVVVEHARQLARHHGFDVDARARPRAGGAELGLRALPGLSVLTLERGARAALRHRRRDVVGDGVLALPGPGRRATRTSSSRSRTASTTRDEAGAPRRGADARPAGRVHHRGALDRGDAARSCAPTRRCTSCATGSTRTSSRRAEPVEPHRDGPLRILIEGNPAVWFKGVAEAIERVRGDARAAPPDARHRPARRCATTRTSTRCSAR